MSKEILAKKELVKKKLEKHIASFSKKRNYNRKWAIAIHLSITLLGAFITILSAINIECFDQQGACIKDFSRFVVIVLGSAVTIIGAYKTFFNNNNLWIKYTITTNKLRKVKADFEYYLSGKEDSEIEMANLNGFNKEIQQILDETNDNWDSLMSNISK